MDQDLNEQLLTACTKGEINFDEVESLLQRGANPMGKVIAEKEINNLYDALWMHFADSEGMNTVFPKLTKLFLHYGMDIDKPEVPYDDNVINPLWNFAFYSEGNGILETLRFLLDYGLSAESAGECWGHILFDSLDVYGKLEDDFCYEMLYQDIRKIILFASYPHVLNNDQDLQNVIWLNQNDYDPRNFRELENFRFSIDTSRCQGEPEVYRSLVTIIEKSTGNAVWTFGFGIDPCDADQ